jgi:hypothetical protein
VSNTAAGGKELLDADKGTSLSHAITGLPTNGSTIYARLWSKNASTGVWVFNDYMYGAAGATFVPAVIISPANLATIGSSSATFQWTAGTGVSQYWLYVSNVAVGGAELYNVDQGAATSRTVAGLPNNSSTIYVRLWSKNAVTGVWVFNDFAYR